MKRPRKSMTLRPVRPNAGIRAKYRKRLLAMIDEMAASYAFWIAQAYERTPPAIAQDAPYGKRQQERIRLASKDLEKELAKLGKRWQARFDDMAERLAGWFAAGVDNRTKAALMHIMRRAGWTVRLKITPALRDVIHASTLENISLIKSIPEQFHTQVHGIVMRSVTAGRDLAQMNMDLKKQFGVTRRRAELLARDQNNKCTAMITRARYLQLGFEEAIWLHSAGGRKPRPTHVANSGKRFNMREGWPDPALGGKLIWPGTEINCRCVCKPVIKGFS